MIVLWNKQQFVNTCDYTVEQWGFIQVLHFVRCCTQLCFMTHIFLYGTGTSSSTTTCIIPPLGGMPAGTNNVILYGTVLDALYQCCTGGNEQTAIIQMLKEQSDLEDDEEEAESNRIRI